LLSKWRIRNKLLLCAALLVAILVTLSASGMYGLYAYRGLVKSLSGRSTELPVAADLGQLVGDLRVILSSVRSHHDLSASFDDQTRLDNGFLREQFRMTLQAIEEKLAQYRQILDHNVYRSFRRIREDRQERETLREIEAALARIAELDQDQDWLLDDVKTIQLAAEVEQLHYLTAELPSYLRQRFGQLADDVRMQYRTAIVTTWATTIAAIGLLILLARLVYKWIFGPLGILIRGSRQVAEGRFGYRIQLKTHDEMSELADAMNDMTERFQAIRNDLDRQVRERTRQVVRSEQLASVGFLAAGVAHEINNPLASIAMCSESLQSRLARMADDDLQQQEVVRHYLDMIHQEAFRCKEITERLLDFSRAGDSRRERTDLRELVAGVIEMVRHMGRFRGKHATLLPGPPVVADVCPQEMKQVVLNLITNGLHSVDAGGTVTVEIEPDGAVVRIVFTDDGCGMDEEVLKHLFEPFFTRRRGGQGIGLGLSITHRIIDDHDGEIEAQSDGPGRGSQFIVTLPLCQPATEKELENRYQAA